MNYKMVGRFMSLVVITEAVFMLPAWIISIINGEDVAATAFAISIIGSIIAGMVVLFLCRKVEIRFMREKVLSVQDLDGLL